MVDQLSQPAVEDEAAAKVLPQPPTAAPPVEPGLPYIDGAWREASDGATAPTITPNGRGGNSDLRSLIDRARAAGRAGHWGSGGTTQSYVHVEDVAELLCLAAELALHGAILHGVAADVTQRDLAPAINRMTGLDERTESLSLLEMLGIDVDAVGNVGGSFTPPATAASGICLSLNKRLSSEKTCKLLDWSPKRADIDEDIAFGSYVN
jgi:nucleoside-diphosphate-sugar epimerase